MASFAPAYLQLHARGELAARAAAARELLACCTLCPRRCKVNRLAGERGVCRTGSQAEVASYGPHFGEESVLVGHGGSGTIFLSHCNLGCVFCQNYEISHLGEGVATPPAQLAAMMVSLQKQGCHNINFVTPSHVVVQLLEAVALAADKGLSVPLVYNTSGYDEVETLRLLDGVVDIYMPDFKFWLKTSAARYCQAADYPEVARLAIAEMHRQVGDLVVDGQGLAQRGLLVRHLVMPEGLAESREIFRFLARGISADTYVNVMEQYRPCGQAFKYPPIDRPLDHGEYLEAVRLAKAAGLHRLDERSLDDFLRKLRVLF
ncbi:MAG: radical SAM protein [Thermodesulfobacteriota bacterium]